MQHESNGTSLFASRGWFDRYTFDFRTVLVTPVTGSRSWISCLGSVFTEDAPRSRYMRPSEAKEFIASLLQSLLNQLQTSANIIGNSKGERAIKVRWSSGSSTNSPQSPEIILSPDDLVDLKCMAIPDQAVDGMTGKVYLAATLRDTVDVRAFNESTEARSLAKGCSVHRCALRIWEAIETMIARHQVIEDWAGFAPYLARDAARSSASKQDVQRYVDNTTKRPCVDGAAVVVSWSLLNPSGPLCVPACYLPCLQIAIDALAHEIAAEDRFRIAKAIALKISELFPVKEARPTSGESPRPALVCGNRERESIFRGRGMPIICDTSLFGLQVSNRVDHELANQLADFAPEEDRDVSVSYRHDKDALAVPQIPTVNLPMSASAEDRQAFAELVRTYSSSIAAIRKSMMFRNTEMRLPSFGHRSGDIDENSLFKLRLDDDRVMCQMDQVRTKRIAVCLLVDESGSMGGEKITEARNVAICLAEGLKGIHGVVASIYGHTAEEHLLALGCCIREYLTPRAPEIASCMQMKGRCENHDGFAIQDTARRFQADYGAFDRKIIFVISDGSPHGADYGGAKALDHVRAVSEACRKVCRIEVYGIGIANAYDNELGARMYGPGNFVVIKDTVSSLQIMARFVAQVAKGIKR